MEVRLTMLDFLIGFVARMLIFGWFVCVAVKMTRPSGFRTCTNFHCKLPLFFFTNLHVIGVVEVEEVAVELGLLPPVGLLAGIFRLKLEREKEVGILAGRKVADLYAAKCIFNGST